jgi:sugar/nucleoside kinase (ribokinase family)
MREFIVLGDLNLDVVLSGMAAPPSFGKEILAQSCTMKPGGSAANAAMVLAMMGARVRLFSAVGADLHGELVLRGLGRCGLTARHIVRKADFATGVTVSLTYPKDRLLITHPAGIGGTRLKDLKPGYIRKGAHLHLCSYFLQAGLRPAVGGLLERAKGAGMSTSLDPGFDPDERWDLGELVPYFRFIDWFLPNAGEIQAVAGRTSLPQALAELNEDFEGVVVKAGAEGAYTRHAGDIRHFPPAAAEVVDTTCAGDCFDAAFLYRLAGGFPLEAAVGWANRIGARAASTEGLPSAKTLREEMER